MKWTGYLKEDTREAWLAGTERHGHNTFIAKAMADVGADINHHESEIVSDLPQKGSTYMVTVRDHVRESCPYFPARITIIHVGFGGPPTMVKDAGTEAEAFDHHRFVGNKTSVYREVTGFY